MYVYIVATICNECPRSYLFAVDKFQDELEN